MRPSKAPSAVGKGKVGIFLGLVGLAYLAYKAEYLALDVPDALKAFIVSPGVVLLGLAVLAAFSDARRRTGGILLMLGGVALVWLAREPLPSGAWTFYTPYSSLDTSPSYLKGSSPMLAAVATLLPFLGFAILTRRSPLGGIFLGASLWCALCLAPSRWRPDSGMPRRYAYYYFQGPAGLRSTEWDRSDAVLPVVLGLAGAALLLRRTQKRGRGDSVSAAPPIGKEP